VVVVIGSIGTSGGREGGRAQQFNNNLKTENETAVVRCGVGDRPGLELILLLGLHFLSSLRK
jgi:hypothetical protein